jgi:hypothetical protein
LRVLKLLHKLRHLLPSLKWLVGLYIALILWLNEAYSGGVVVNKLCDCPYGSRLMDLLEWLVFMLRSASILTVR